MVILVDRASPNFIDGNLRPTRSSPIRFKETLGAGQDMVKDTVSNDLNGSSSGLSNVSHLRDGP
jgi:hypothetical protein